MVVISNNPKEKSMYQSKINKYFGNPRKDIEPAIKFNRSATVLELGCGNGSTLIWLKESNRCNHVTGIDAFAECSDSNAIDQFYKFDLNNGLPQDCIKKYDAILCLDVLEHLIDPWELTKKLRPLLKENGQLIVSLPNLQNYHVVLSLLFNGEFNYQEEGILDRTHLRFFTKKTSIHMLQNAGFRIDNVFYPGKATILRRLLNAIGLRNHLTKQFIFSCS